MRIQILSLSLASLFLIGAAPTPQVEVHDGRLSVTVSDVPLEEVLKAISDQSHLTITIEGDPNIGERQVSMNFDLPFDEGLARLINGWDYAMFKDPETGQRTLLVFTDLSGQTGVHRKTTTFAQARTWDAQSLEGEPAFPEAYTEAFDISPPPTYSRDQHNSSPSSGDPFPDQDGREGLITALQSQDPMDRQMALIELGPLSPDNPELLLEIEYLSAQDSDPMVQEMATEMLKQFSHQE